VNGPFAGRRFYSMKRSGPITESSVNYRVTVSRDHTQTPAFSGAGALRVRMD